MKPAISRIFSDSPFGPIQSHMRGVVEVVKMLPGFFEACGESDFDSAEAIYNDIAVRENDLDILKKEVIKRLPKGIFTPVPRQELAALVHEQDQVANNCMELTGRMVSRPIPIPEPLQKAYREYILVSVKAVKGVSGYVHKMDELITTGFQGPPAHEVATGLAKLENLEDTIPEMTFKLRRAVFEVEKTLDPVHAMFLYRVVDRQEELIRNIFDVGDQLATMVTS